MENIEQKQPTTREAVILDALRLIVSRKLDPRYRCFLFPNRRIASGEAVEREDSCRVCALGSLFYSRFRGTPTKNVHGLSWMDLEHLFSKEEMRVIEVAFDGDDDEICTHGEAVADLRGVARWGIWAATGEDPGGDTPDDAHTDSRDLEDSNPDRHLRRILCNMLMNGGSLNVTDFTEYDSAAVLRTYGFNSQGEKNDV